MPRANSEQRTAAPSAMPAPVAKRLPRRSGGPSHRPRRTTSRRLQQCCNASRCVTLLGPSRRGQDALARAAPMLSTEPGRIVSGWI